MTGCSTSGKMQLLHAPTVFVSDVHLGCSDVHTNGLLERDFLELLRWCERENTQIVLLGDIFDYFMAYPGYIPVISRAVLTWFEGYHQRTGVKTLYVTGNHDNWDFGYFDSVGFDTEHEYRILQTQDGLRVMTFHGDGLRDPAFRYPRPFVHRLLRNRMFTTGFQLFTSGRTGNGAMEWFSARSRRNDNGGEQEAKALDAAAARFLSEKRAEVVLCGHHHRVRKQNFSGLQYMNTGAFFVDRSACLYTKGDFRLVRWDGAVKTLLTLT